MKKIFLGVMFAANILGAQNIEQAKSLEPFFNKLKANKEVTNILLLGDSHIQAGHISDFLRHKFQEKFGNAGRGTVFPYALANSNGSQDFSSYSNQAWVTFRSVYEQNIYPQMGAMGFVMGNNADSFIEMNFNNTEDSFDLVRIFSDPTIKDQDFSLYSSDKSLKDFVTIKKTLVKYKVEDGETFPELAAKFNVVTTRLAQLNGNAIKNPKAGQIFTMEKVEPVYNAEYENYLHLLTKSKFQPSISTIKYTQKKNRFIMRLNASPRNILYGFQFLKSDAKNGVVFNSVGINGAKYSDFVKFPIQLDQLDVVSPDVALISLGTNEAMSAITKQEFLDSVTSVVKRLKKNNENLSVVLIAPTDNNMNAKKTEEVVGWVKEASANLNVGYIDMFKLTGGRGYFSKALKEKKASADNVHFLKGGYEDQAQIIWNVLEKNFK